MNNTTLIQRITTSTTRWVFFVLMFVSIPLSVSAKDALILDKLSPAEMQWLSENKTIRLGIDRAFPPFGTITEDNEYVGFTADWMRLVSEKLGIEFEIFKDSTWNETLSLAKSGKIDMIAGLVNTQERQAYLEFSKSYIETPTVIFNDGLKNGYIGTIKNLKGKTVAVEQGSFASDMLSKEYPDINQLQVKNTGIALSIVATNKADAYIGNAVTASYLIKKMGFHNLFYSGDTPYSSNHSIGVIKHNPLLASIMNKTLASINQKARDKIATKWFGMQVFPSIRRSTVIGMGVIGLVALLLSALWIKTLYKTRKDLRISERKVRHQANIDSLTGLINRRHMYDILTEKTTSSQEGFALFFLDLDAFKEVNDSLGHSIGDELLKSVARRLRNHVSSDDIVGRLGGDEFIIILNTTNQPKDIASIAQDICDSLSSDFIVQGHSIDVSTSIGITLFPQDAATPDNLLVNADQAMYASKKNGSNGFMLFDETMRESMALRNETLRDLKLALPKGQFELYYQPIYNLLTGEITKAEALIRWNHPERGMIRPDLFIQLSEESGMINELGEWIFHEAATQVAEWRAKYAPHLQVSINTSPIQYRDKGFDIKNWCAHLESLGLSGQALIVEITEGLLMESSSAVKAKLWGLRDAGIEVAIDDFGTGYSSLSYLKKFHIDYLKIDQSFVSNLSAHSEDFVLCEAITVMAHKLGCTVVAEGIETEEQSLLLKEAGCDYGQGYLFSRPIPASEFSALLSNVSRQSKVCQLASHA
ncbi:EAL domain-containing protein [Leucothrix arctica]|uniref:Diguanylate cyclase n=1 Tax=Leucothrix arctica TaxID=1481894 RepID=A0A317CES1_9GAMM|nr:EAL domain-containing protein [Leucothrix arctica]PWQ95853.1 hypothetical protein DKT75_10740 [Leucothrix arctica]